MTNYKPRFAIYTTFSAITTPWPETQTFKILSYPFANSAVEQSLRDEEDNADYVVPTGKTFNMIGFIVSHTTQALTRNWYQSDTADALTTLKSQWTAPGFAGTSEVFTNMTFAAGKYITFDPTLSGINFVQAIGYETTD